MRKIYFAGRKIGTAYFGNMLVYRSVMKVSVPSVTDTVKTYNGAAQSPTISGYDSSIIQVTGNSYTDAGSYNIIFHLKDSSKYQWTDGTITDKSVIWTIARKSIVGATITLGGELIYTGDQQTQSISSVKIDGLDVTYTVMGNQQTNAGNYTLTITATGNFIDSQTKSWSIAQKSISGATITLGSSYTYTGQMVTQTVNSVTIDGLSATYSVSGNTGIDAGNYTLTVTGNGNFTGDATKGWSIGKASVGDKPSATVSRTYNRSSQNNGYSTPSGVSMTGNNSGTTVGDYTATYTPDSNHCWSDGTTAAASCKMIIAAYNISGCTIDTPSAVTYNGSEQKPTPAVKHDGAALSSSTEFTYSYSNNTNAGTATVTATGKGNYTGTKSVNFTINRASVGDKPATTVSKTYNGSSQSNGYTTPAGVSMTGNNSGTNAGEYTATYTPDDNHKWSDDSTGAVSIKMTIAKLSLAIPSVSGGGVYKASAYTAIVSNFNGTWENQTGTVTATGAGTYTVSWSLKDTTNTQWSDGTITDKSKTWSITALSLTVPTLSNASKTYSGTSQSPTVNNYNSTYETQSGTTSATNSGTYTIEWTLKDTTNTKWADGTTTKKTATWYINKKIQYLYKNGDMYTSFTGGWVQTASNGFNYVGGYHGPATWSSSSDGLCISGNSGNRTHTGYVTVNKIDTTGFSKLCCSYEISFPGLTFDTDGGLFFALYFDTSYQSNYWWNKSRIYGVTASSTARSGHETVSLNISGKQKLVVDLFLYRAVQSSAYSVKVHEIWLESN